MIHSKVIIVGGGPAGASCGLKLREMGMDCLILEKAATPGKKPCAGWITPQVLKDLNIEPNDYPYGLRKFRRFIIHTPGRTFPVPVRQYAIRRSQFDPWLLKRSGVPIKQHHVKVIRKAENSFIIDNAYRCEYLVGAGGTHCPVRKTFFAREHPRDKNSLVVTLEEEFSGNSPEETCHLWFLFNKLPGYAWYIPKNDGFVNVGIGGFQEKLKNRHQTIKEHWQLFTEELERLSLIKDHSFRPRGYPYYLRSKYTPTQSGRVFLTGDAAGLATKDMGEGIGPAVKSGILTAEAIATGNPLSLKPVRKFSFPVIHFLGLMGSRLVAPSEPG